MSQDTRRAGPQWGVSERTMGIVSTAVIFLIGVVMMIDNYKIGSGWAKDGPQAGYFPFRIGAIICVASVVVLARMIADKSGRDRMFVTWDRLKLVLVVLVPTAAYVLVIQLAGIYVASAVFIAGFMRIMGRYGWAKAVAVGIATSATLFWLFEIQFLVPLPKGPLEALFGY
jgi:hypothetical protein